MAKIAFLLGDGLPSSTVDSGVRECANVQTHHRSSDLDKILIRHTACIGGIVAGALFTCNSDYSFQGKICR